MLRISEIKVALDKNSKNTIMLEISKRIDVSINEIESFQIVKKSIDARKKSDVHFVYTVDVCIKVDECTLIKRLNDTHIKIVDAIAYSPPRTSRQIARPVVVGMGPAGLFAALILAKCGVCPIIVERGGDVDHRIKSVNNFWNGFELDTQCNVQFGEGGAGTFSDGKLTTNINDIRCRFVLDEFIRHGAPPEIAYLSKPHIGTDILRSVVKNIRKTIVSLGGDICFNTRLDDIIYKDDKIIGVTLFSNDNIQQIACSDVIMAIGHSARDTFEMLNCRGVSMAAKPFAIGVRIEHMQNWLNACQYGEFAGHNSLIAADYKLAAHLPSGRSVYTFCMCPGGVVVAASSERGCVVTNGMSYHARDGLNANAALLCEVYPSDFDNSSPLAGVWFQQKWERAAFEAGGGSYKAPASCVGDFLNGNVSTSWGNTLPSYMPGVVFGDISHCLPDYVVDSLKLGITAFDKRLPGFAHHDAVVTGVETRSSSPVRILRNTAYQSNIAGLYPCGEGAGYAGGIMSAAVDGIKVAEAIIRQ